MKFKLAFLVLTLVTASANARPLLRGTDASEALMAYDHFVEMTATAPPTEKEAIDQIRKQALYLFGSMAAADVPGAPRGDDSITIHRVARAQRSASKRPQYRVEYTWKGTVYLKRGPLKHYSVTLPNNPDSVWYHSSVDCTDPAYPGPTDFWYFF